jgi:hypothetical protein
MAEPLTLLINRLDMIPYCQVAIHAREESMIQPHILASQLVDLKPVLGNAFYTDLIANRLDDKYKELLEGGEYTNDDGNLVTFQGLKAVLSCYSYARYMFSKNAVDTPFGMVVKTSEYSDPVDSNMITQVASAKRSEGTAYLNECIQFIKDNSDVYPLYESDCNKKPNNKLIHKLTGASRI